jgi:hypothetical protein
VSNRDRLKLTPDLTTRWATGNDNFVSSSLWDFKSSFICRKILRHGTFPLYFPSERKVCCGFLSPLHIHRIGRVFNPQPLGPVASTLTTTSPTRPFHRTSPVKWDRGIDSWSCCGGFGLTSVFYKRTWTYRVILFASFPLICLLTSLFKLFRT